MLSIIKYWGKGQNIGQLVSAGVNGVEMMLPQYYMMKSMKSSLPDLGDATSNALMYAGDMQSHVNDEASIKRNAASQIYKVPDKETITVHPNE